MMTTEHVINVTDVTVNLPRASSWFRVLLHYAPHTGRDTRPSVLGSHPAARRLNWNSRVPSVTRQNGAPLDMKIGGSYGLGTFRVPEGTVLMVDAGLNDAGQRAEQTTGGRLSAAQRPSHFTHRAYYLVTAQAGHRTITAANVAHATVQAQPGTLSGPLLPVTADFVATLTAMQTKPEKSASFVREQVTVAPAVSVTAVVDAESQQPVIVTQRAKRRRDIRL